MVTVLKSLIIGLSKVNQQRNSMTAFEVQYMPNTVLNEKIDGHRKSRILFHTELFLAYIHYVISKKSNVMKHGNSVLFHKHLPVRMLKALMLTLGIVYVKCSVKIKRLNERKCK